jgi:hypothetical protein
MKKLTLTLFLLIFSLISFPALASAEVSDADKQEISAQMHLLIEAVNNSNTEKITDLLSPNASEELKLEIVNNIENKDIDYKQNIGLFEKLENNKIKVKGKYSASGLNWHSSGFSNYFIFEKNNNEWLLVESNFAKKLSIGYIFESIKTILLYIIPIFLILTIFWIWMIIDVATRPIDEKIVWVLIVIFLNFLGAIIYFFTARRKYLKTQKRKTNKNPENNNH